MVPLNLLSRVPKVLPLDLGLGVYRALGLRDSGFGLRGSDGSSRGCSTDLQTMKKGPRGKFH